MKVYADVRSLVEIDPRDVIEKLLEESIGRRGWVFEKDGKYYQGLEVGAGNHSYNDEEEITKEKFDYIKALKLVLSKLKLQ